MKKILLITLFALSFSLSFAQKFKGGLILGFANTDVYGTDPEDVDYNKIGFNIGLFTELPISEKSDLRFEMYFIQKGSYIPPPTDSVSIANGIFSSYRLRLNYVEFPIIYSHKLPFTVAGKTIDRFCMEIGPSFGFLVYSDEDYNQNGPNPVYGTQFKKYDISAALGFSYLIAEGFKFHFRYENSILPIRPHPGGTTGINPNTYYYNSGEVNMVFTYTLSYTF